jgi:hypothetical protein
MGGDSTLMSGIGKAGKLAGIGGAAVGVLAALNGMVQKAGEKATEYTQLGSVQGGGLMEGAGLEMQARIMGMNPFITTEQSRQIMQMALKEGFRGGQFDTVQGFMAKNFKDMGLSFSDQMQLINSSLKSSGDSTKDFTQNMKSLQDTLDTMKKLTKQGGAALPEREAQLQGMMETGEQLGIPAQSTEQATLQLQEDFGQNKTLREAVPGIVQQAEGSDIFWTMAGAAYGIHGLPEEIPGELADKGVNVRDAFLKIARQNANKAKGMGGNQRHQAAMFHQLMQAYGIPMTPNQALALYRELTGGRDIEGQTADRLGHGGDYSNQSWGERIGGAFGDIFDKGASGLGAHLLTGDFSAAGEEITHPNEWFPNPVDAFKRIAGIGGSGPTRGFDAQGRPAPAAEAGSPSAPIQTQGQVNGTLRVTVDQQGRVSAPQTIQLSGQQKTVNAGYGAAMLNNSPPGDPTYSHAYSAYGGG